MAISYFITSTGTGIGKTYVTSALIRQARSRNLSVAAYKPVISGFDKSEIAGSDTGEILAALGEAPTEAAVARISPWRFKAPLAPNMAARAEGATLDCDALFSFTRKALAEKHDVTLIEGVGGIMVPLDDERTVLDWIVAAGAPVILVVGDYLGTISHTLTAIEVLRAKGVAIAGLVVSESGESSVGFDETLAEMEKWTAPARVLGLRRGADGSTLAVLLA